MTITKSVFTPSVHVWMEFTTPNPEIHLSRSQNVAAAGSMLMMWHDVMLWHVDKTYNESILSHMDGWSFQIPNSHLAFLGAENIFQSITMYIRHLASLSLAFFQFLMLINMCYCQGFMAIWELTNGVMLLHSFDPFPTIICCSCKMAMKPFCFPIHLSARSMNESAVRMLATDSAYLLQMAICSWNFQLKSETLWGFKCFVVTYFVIKLHNNRCLCNWPIYRSWMNTSRIKCM